MSAGAEIVTRVAAIAEERFCGVCGKAQEEGERRCSNCDAAFEDDVEPEAAAPVEPPAPAPSPPPIPRSKGWSYRINDRVSIRFLPLLAGIAVGVSSAIDWVRGANAFDIPVRFLWDMNAQTGFRLGIPVLIVGIAVAVLSFFTAAEPLRRIAGLVALVIAVLFLEQFVRGIDRNGGSIVDGLDAVRAGAWVCLAGGFAGLTTR